MAPPLCTQLNNSLLAATYNNHNHLIMASTTTAAANLSPPSTACTSANCDEESTFVTIAHHLMQQQQQQQQIGHDHHQYSPNYNCDPNHHHHHHHNNNNSFYSNSHSNNPSIYNYPFTSNHGMDHHPPFYFSNWGAPHDALINTNTNTNTNYNAASSNYTWQQAKSNDDHRHHHGGENQERIIASVTNNSNGCFHSCYVPDDEDEDFDLDGRDDDGHHVMIETVPSSHASSPLLLIDQPVLNTISTDIPNHPDYIYNSSSSSSSRDESASALDDQVVTDHKDTTIANRVQMPPTMAIDSDPSNIDGQLIISTSLTRNTSGAGIYNNDSNCSDQSLSTVGGMTMDQIYNFGGGLANGYSNNQSDHGMFHRDASGRLNTMMMQVNRTQSDDVIEALLLKPASRSGSGVSNCLDWLESLMELEAHEHVDDINTMDTHQYYNDANRNSNNLGLLDHDDDEEEEEEEDEGEDEEEDQEEEEEEDGNRQELNLDPMVNAIGFVNNNTSSTATNEGGLPLVVMDLQEGSGPYTCMDEDELDGQVNMADAARLLLDDGDNKNTNVTNSSCITSSHGSVSPVSTTTTATATNGMNGHHHDHHPEAAVSVHGVELMQLLLECAKCVDSDPRRSISLLPKLRSGSTRHGDPIQRLTSYFTEALSCRLARRLTSSHEPFIPPPPPPPLPPLPPTGNSSSSSCNQNIHECMGNPGGGGGGDQMMQDQIDILKGYNSATDTVNHDDHELAMAYKAMNDACPYFTFAQLTANQAILETMLQMEYLSDTHLLQQFLHSRQSSAACPPNDSSSSSNNYRYDIHIVDFGISQGVQWAALLQAMAYMEVDGGGGGGGNNCSSSSSSSSSSNNTAEYEDLKKSRGDGGDERSRCAHQHNMMMMMMMKNQRKKKEEQSRRRRRRRRIKITGIASPELGQRWEEAVEATGRRLVEFGASMDVEVEFRKAEVALGDERLSPEMVGVEEGEVVVVNFMLELSNVLEGGAVARVLSLAASLRPKLVTLAELDADLNTAPFQRRFVSALHFFSAMFDSLEASPMGRDSPHRLCMERRLLGRRIVSMVGGPDPGPRRRLQSFADWHAAMSAAGFRPTSLGVYAADQARILLLRFTFCQSFTLTEQQHLGGALSLGWLHKPLLTVSAWTL